MRVLVIGGGGLLGSHLVDRLTSGGHEVAICDNFSGSIQYRVPSGTRILTANATDLNSMEHVFSVFRPEIVVSALAHYFSADTIYRFFDDTRLILEGANVLSYLLGRGVKRVIFCSSQEVYDGSAKPIKETKKVKLPYSFHGAAKAAAEGILEHRCTALGIPLTTVRIFDLFGPRFMFCARTGVVNFLIDALLTDEQVGLSGPKRLRDFIHAADAASAIEGLIEAEAEGVYNVGTGSGLTLSDLAAQLGKHIEVVYPPQPLHETAGKRKSLVADVSKLRGVLGSWEPERNLVDSLGELVSFRRGELELYNNSPESAARVLEAMRGRIGV